MRFRRFGSAALFLLGLLFLGSAAAFTGEFTGQLDGQRVVGKLREQAGSVAGTVEIGGYVYRVRARTSGKQAIGELLDEAGVRVPLVLSREANTVTLAIRAQGQGGPVTQISLTRAQAGSPAATRPQDNARRQVDPALVGHWRKSESYTSGDFSVASDTNIELRPDGTYRFGASKLYGGGDAGTFGSESAGGGEQGRWSTSNRILYVFDPDSGQWSPYARYYVEGNSALLTYGNGKREVWERRR